METKKYFRISKKEAQVLTVPMRNGNIPPNNLGVELSLVLTVPMRNGNDKRGSREVHIPECSYRTYEEWKPTQFHVASASLKVLTVPMRNGNDHLVFF